MKTTLSLPPGKIAEAHRGGLWPTSYTVLDLSSHSVADLEELPIQRLPSQLLSAGDLERLAETLGSMERHIGTLGLGAQVADQIAQQQVAPALSAIQQMEDQLGRTLGLGAQVADQIPQQQVAPALSAIQQMEDQLGRTLGFGAQVADQIAQQQVAPALSAIQQMEDQLGRTLGLGAQVADQIAQQQVAPALSAAQAFQRKFGELGRDVNHAAMFARALAQAQIAEEPPSAKERRFSSTPQQINFYLDYLVSSVPSVTWEWIINHPVATNLLVAFLLWAIPPPYELINDKSKRKKFDKEVRKVVIPSKVEVQNHPSSSAITKDTIYRNNTVEQIDQNGPWVKVEYKDRVEGKTGEGWVLRHYLDSGE